jgi:hypothetical protein
MRLSKVCGETLLTVYNILNKISSGSRTRLIITSKIMISDLK